MGNPAVRHRRGRGNPKARHGIGVDLRCFAAATRGWFPDAAGLLRTAGVLEPAMLDLVDAGGT
jgi:hypothetical protein